MLNISKTHRAAFDFDTSFYSVNYKVTSEDKRRMSHKLITAIIYSSFLFYDIITVVVVFRSNLCRSLN